MALYSHRKIYLSLIVFLILLIGLNALGALSGLKYFFRSLFVPVLTKANEIGVKIGNNYHYFRNKDEFFNEYTTCVDNLRDKDTISAQNKILEDENAELKKQLNFVQHNNFKTVAANVVGLNADSIEKTLILNVGDTEGVKVGQPVIVGEGIIVGKITKVDKEISVVMLVNDSKSKVAGTLLNKEHSLGVIEAGYGNSMIMDFIPRNEVVRVGDDIVTSGQEIEIPHGLLIGKVTSVENEAYKPFQQAVVDPSVELDKISVVTVILTN